MVQSSKTFRIFVSSTFSDLKEERNILQKYAFPKLRELCAQHGFKFQAIDLRWGVSEEAGLDQQTMNICLQEIERSQKVSPKPNFIVLLGNRYGWQPLPAEIEAEEFKRILEKVSADEEELLLWKEEQTEDKKGWYRLDENAVPPVYCLQPRTGDYVNYDKWTPVEQKLHSILLGAAFKSNLSKDDFLKYYASATEQEIVRGALKVKDAKDHVFCFFRKIENLPDNKDFVDLDSSGNIDDNARDRLENLKGKLCEQLPESHIKEYNAEWVDNGVSNDHLEKLCDDVYESLEKIILGKIEEIKEIEPLDQEIEAHEEFGKDRAKFFTGRTKILNDISRYLENGNISPLAIYGESGSGKSALMAKAVQDAHNNYPDLKIITRFICATPNSSEIRSLLASLCQQINQVYMKSESGVPSEYDSLVTYFSERLRLATKEEPIFIFLDALDQLSNSDDAHSLNWLPDTLPYNVHVVVSSIKGNFYEILKNKMPEENLLKLGGLKKVDGEDLLKLWLKDGKRTLQQEQWNEVINKFQVNGLPLYLKLAFEEVKNWKSYTKTPELESDIPGIIRQMFNRLSAPESHGKTIFSHSLGYLSAARKGLAEDEILDILALDNDVFNLTKKFHNPPEEKLPVALWSRLYFDLEPYLTEKNADGILFLSFYHRQIGEVAKLEYLNEDVKKSRHEIIAKYFLNQAYSIRDGLGDEKIELIYEIDSDRVFGVWKGIPRFSTELLFHLKSARMWNELVYCLQEPLIFKYLNESTYGVNYHKGSYNVDPDPLEPDNLSIISPEQRSKIGYGIANALGEHSRSLIKKAYTFKQPWPETAQKLRESDLVSFANYRDTFYSFAWLSKRAAKFAKIAFNDSKDGYNELNDFLTKNNDIISFTQYLDHFGYGETGLSHAIEDEANYYLWEELYKIRNDYQKLQEKAEKPQNKSKKWWKFWK